MRGRRCVSIGFVCLLVGLLVADGTKARIIPGFPEKKNKEDIMEPPHKPPKQAENLSSLLYRLTLASNPKQFARQHELFICDNRVRVIIKLAPGCKKVEGEYGITVEGVYENLVQALAPISQLISLSKDSSVLFIRPPARPLPLIPGKEKNDQKEG